MKVWEKVGSICIDSGTLLVGDPCYHLDRRDENKATLYAITAIGAPPSRRRRRRRRRRRLRAYLARPSAAPPSPPLPRIAMGAMP